MTAINTNIGAINAQANLMRVNEEMGVSMERLSSGKRINAAKDDSAGMAIAEKMTSQIMGLNQAVRNANDGKNLLDTTEGAHVEVSNMLQRLRELAVQSSNDTNTASDRGNITSEGQALITEINRVSTDTTFNGMKILDGSYSGKQFQIGADSGQTIDINVDSVHTNDIGAHKLSTQVAINAAAGDNGRAAAETVAITGHTGSAEITTTAGMSAKDLASEVNKVSATTGVEATAVTTAKLDNVSGVGNIKIEINDVQIGTVAVTDASDLKGLRDAINNKTGQTGVTAKMGDTDGEIILTDKQGNDISITNYEDTSGNAVTMDMTTLNKDKTEDATADVETLSAANQDATSVGQVEMTSMKAFSVGGGGTADTNFLEATSNTSDLETVAEIDLTTAEGASNAVKTIDVALNKINQSRSDLGAVSNRLDSTISNLTNITVNVEAARGQVMDADFAKESSEMARGKILSQAATSMLAQANASSQNVLSLLRG
jgi:flagellin